MGPGFKVCGLHGGDAPQVQAAALARRARMGLGYYTPGRPDEILLTEIARTNGIVLWLEHRLAQEPEEALTWGVAEERETVEEAEGVRNATLTRTSRAGPTVLVAWYQWERRHLVTACAEALKAGIAERLVELAKEQGVLINRMFLLLLDKLNLSEEQRHLADEAVPEVMAEALRAA